MANGYSLELFCESWARKYEIASICITLGKAGCCVYKKTQRSACQAILSQSTIQWELVMHSRQPFYMGITEDGRLCALRVSPTPWDRSSPVKLGLRRTGHSKSASLLLLSPNTKWLTDRLSILADG